MFVEKDYNCMFTSGDTNAVTKQGIFVLDEGQMKITSNGDWYGAIYAVNAQGSSDVLVDIKGTPTVHGGIFVDGTAASTSAPPSRTSSTTRPCSRRCRPTAPPGSSRTPGGS